MDTGKLIKDHLTALDNVADEKSKLWWEKYMKDVIAFRGVGIPKNRELLSMWRVNNGISNLPFEEQFEIALTFFKEPYAEDKLAGILYLQEYLYNKLPWELQVTRFESIYDDALIYDWNVCDWFCIRVLGPMIQKNGERCASHIGAWKDAPYLWQARSSLVPFVNLVSTNTYYPLITDISATLIRREERFAKTAVGWILRDISKHDVQFVFEFLDRYLADFTTETINNALKYKTAEVRRSYVLRLRQLMQK